MPARIKIVSAVAVCCASALGACSSTVPARDSAGESGAVFAHEVARASQAAEPAPELIKTSLTPTESAKQIREVYQDLDLTVYGGGDGDYFSARADAATAMGHRIDAACEWVRDGETRVSVGSNLPANQHALVLARIRQKLAAAATRPAATRSADH